VNGTERTAQMGANA